jgi:hypothetical protein
MTIIMSMSRSVVKDIRRRRLRTPESSGKRTTPSWPSGGRYAGMLSRTVPKHISVILVRSSGRRDGTGFRAGSESGVTSLDSQRTAPREFEGPFRVAGVFSTLGV